MDNISKYDREEVIRELEKRGLHAKYYHGTQVISHFEAPEHAVLGLKVLGMLDYLNARVVRRHHDHGGHNGLLHKDKKYKAVRHHEDYETVYAWFTTREAAEKWVEEQRKNPRLGFRILKCEIFPTEDMAYRACVAGNGAI